MVRVACWVSDVQVTQAAGTTRHSIYLFVSLVRHSQSLLNLCIDGYIFFRRSGTCMHTVPGRNQRILHTHMVLLTNVISCEQLKLTKRCGTHFACEYSFRFVWNKYLWAKWVPRPLISSFLNCSHLCETNLSCTMYCSTSLNFLQEQIHRSSHFPDCNIHWNLWFRIVLLLLLLLYFKLVLIMYIIYIIYLCALYISHITKLLMHGDRKTIIWMFKTHNYNTLDTYMQNTQHKQGKESIKVNQNITYKWTHNI